jgi:putative pyruvate formate lyase activating enzyme
MLYYGEERELVPSHQIHFAGCNLRCEFCVVSEWNEAPLAAEVIDFDEMAGRITSCQREGAKTLNFVGGEPTVHLHGVLELLSRVNPGIKVVWNSNMYYNDIVDELMAGLVDVYLADFKCSNNTCAEVLLGANNYVEVVIRNILKAVRRADVIVRHVVLPGHGDCCLKPILSWLRTEVPNVKLSLRGNYVPPVHGLSAPREYLEPEEMRGAEGLAKSMGLKLVK